MRTKTSMRRDAQVQGALLSNMGYHSHPDRRRKAVSLHLSTHRSELGLSQLLIESRCSLDNECCRFPEQKSQHFYAAVVKRFSV
jgi:hypothetical protein